MIPAGCNPHAFLTQPISNMNAFTILCNSLGRNCPTLRGGKQAVPLEVTFRAWPAGMAGGHFLIRVNYGIYCLLPHPLISPKVPSQASSRASQASVPKTEKGLALSTSDWNKKHEKILRHLFFSGSTSGNSIVQVLRPNTWEDPWGIFLSHPPPYPSSMQTLSVLPSQYTPDPTTLVQGATPPCWAHCSSLFLTSPLLPLLLPFNLFLRDSVKTKALFSSESSTLPSSATRMATITKTASDKCW